MPGVVVLSAPSQQAAPRRRDYPSRGAPRRGVAPALLGGGSVGPPCRRPRGRPGGRSTPTTSTASGSTAAPAAAPRPASPGEAAGGVGGTCGAVGGGGGRGASRWALEGGCLRGGGAQPAMPLPVPPQLAHPPCLGPQEVGGAQPGRDGPVRGSQQGRPHPQEEAAGEWGRAPRGEGPEGSAGAAPSGGVEGQASPWLGRSSVEGSPSGSAGRVVLDRALEVDRFLLFIDNTFLAQILAWERPVVSHGNNGL